VHGRGSTDIKEKPRARGNMKDQIDWARIKHRWIKGESAYAISKSLGGRPSKQGISQKANREDWATLRQPGVLSDKHEEKSLVALGQDTPEARQAFLDALSKGVYQSIAAPACFGVTYQTVKNWRDKDPDFEMQVKNARARFAARHIQNIDQWSEKDWKASKYLLEVSPETRDQFSPPQAKGGGGVTFQFQFSRNPDVTVIEGEAEEVS